MKQERPFPYMQLFGIVVASLLVTTILFWVWHTVEIRALLSAHEKENNVLRTEITLLTAHAETIGTTSKKKI